MKHRPEYDMKIIGNNLRRLREAKNFSVEDVREYLRLGSVQAVYKYEEGRGYPPTDTMFALMELYEAGLKDIIYETPEYYDWEKLTDVQCEFVYQCVLRGKNPVIVHIEARRNNSITRTGKYYESMQKYVNK